MKRVLLVEDCPTDVKLFEAWIKQFGLENEIELHVAGDFKQAEKALHAGTLARPAHDLIITDLRMPFGSGVEVLRILKSIYPNHKIPVVVVTGSTLDELEDEEIKELFDLGAQAVVCKGGKDYLLVLEYWLRVILSYDILV